MNQRVKRYFKNCIYVAYERVKSVYKTKYFQNLFIVIRSKLDAIEVPFETFFVARPQMIEKLDNTCLNCPK